MTNPEKTLSDNLYKSIFCYELTNLYGKIAKRIFKDWSEKRDSGDKTPFDDLYSTNEKKIQRINDYFNSLITVISDIEKTVIFLRINKETVLNIYPELEYQKEYYKYHFENYIIRINSISDILGKLGNILYETNIIDKKCNGYNFKEKLIQIDKKSANIVEKLLEKISSIKTFRHQKLHTGKTDISYLENILFFDNIEKLTGEKTDPILVEYTENQVSEEIKSIEIEVVEIIKIVNEFLNKSVEKLKTIANNGNRCTNL